MAKPEPHTVASLSTQQVSPSTPQNQTLISTSTQQALFRTSEQQHFSFNDLPAEIRNQIYTDSINICRTAIKHKLRRYVSTHELYRSDIIRIPHLALVSETQWEHFCNEVDGVSLLTNNITLHEVSLRIHLRGLNHGIDDLFFPDAFYCNHLVIRAEIDRGPLDDLGPMLAMLVYNTILPIPPHVLAMHSPVDIRMAARVICQLVNHFPNVEAIDICLKEVQAPENSLWPSTFADIERNRLTGDLLKLSNKLLLAKSLHIAFESVRNDERNWTRCLKRHESSCFGERERCGSEGCPCCSFGEVLMMKEEEYCEDEGQKEEHGLADGESIDWIDG